MDDSLARKNKRMMLYCVAGVFSMIGVSYAAVPLYDLFCRVTGFGGTTQVSEAAPDEIHDRVIKVRFDSMTNSHLPWRFSPAQREMELRVGETGLAFYRAQNVGQETSWGTATFNVTPQKAGAYFAKTQCFCFTEQALEPGQEIEMPVTFFVDPSILEDENLDDVNTITLSYTFFRMSDEDIEDARTAMLESLEQSVEQSGTN